MSKISVQRLNHTFERFPQESAVSLLGCEIVSIFGVHQLIQLSGLYIPASFALGFAVSRPFRRVRLPLELIFAAGLRRILPDLAKVKMSTLIGGQVPSSIQTSPVIQKMKSWRATQAITDAIDSYGACYFIGARWTGVLSVLLFTTLIEAGIDIQPIIESMGVPVTLSNQLGTWAAAVTLSSLLYPLSVGVGGVIIAPALGEARLKVLNSSKETRNQQKSQSRIR